MILTLVLRGKALMPTRSCKVFWTASSAVMVVNTNNASIAKGYTSVLRTHHVRLWLSRIFRLLWISSSLCMRPRCKAPFLRHIKPGFVYSSSSSSSATRPQLGGDIGAGDTYDFPVAFTCCSLQKHSNLIIPGINLFNYLIQSDFANQFFHFV